MWVVAGQMTDLSIDEIGCKWTFISKDHISINGSVHVSKTIL